MNMTFTDYARALSEDSSASDLEIFNEALSLLKKALVHEMKKRGLWSGHPRHLGIDGGSRWHEDILEELVLDAYEFIFVRRLPGLLKQLLISSDIDSLVFHNLRLFLHERQKQNDPIGYRTFEMLHASVEQLCKKAALHILEGDARIRNETLLGFTPWSSETTDEPFDFAPRVRLWNDELLPGLIDSRGKAKQEVIRRLENLIVDLQGDVEAFRFKDLVFPLKSDVRARWMPELLFAEAEAVLPDLEFEIWQSFWKLRSCVSEKLSGSEKSGKTTDYLQKLWLFLWKRAAEIEESDPSIQTSASGEPRLSDLALSKSLEIPRDRIPGLKKSLGRLALACREELLAASPQRPTTTARRENLRGETRAAAARFAQMRSSMEIRGDRTLSPGDIFFPRARPLAVDWLVLEHDPARELCLIVPVDDHPLAGSQDISTAGSSIGNIRCQLGASLDVRAFEDHTRVGALDSGLLKEVRDRRSASAAAHPSAFEQEVDADPEYVSWMEELSQAQTTQLTKVSRDNVVTFPDPKQGAKDKGLQGSRKRQAWGNLLALAASILLIISIGFIVRQSSEIEELEIWVKENEAVAQQLDEKEKEIEQLLTGHSLEKHEFEERLAHLRRETTELKQQLAESSSRIAQLEDEIKAPVMVASRSLSRRRSGETLRLKEGAGSNDFVEIYLDLEGDNSYSSYRAVLKTSKGAHVWTDKDLPVRSSEFGPEVVVTLRVGQLSVGAYEISLEGLDPDGAVINLGKYKFGAERDSG